MAMTNPRQSLVDVARKWIGTRETSRNQFEGMQGVWSATNYPDGWSNREPYCAAFVCYVVREAAKREFLLSVKHLPRNAAVRDWKAWAREPQNGVQIFKPNEIEPMPGDIVSFLPNLSHIGLVESFDAKRSMVSTIEGNTSPTSSSNEGDGIFRRERRLMFCGEFYRLPCKATA